VTMLLSMAWTSSGWAAAPGIPCRGATDRSGASRTLSQRGMARRARSFRHARQTVQTGSDAEGRTLWNTWMGEMWMPPGTAGHTVAMLASEMRANIYALSGARRFSSIVAPMSASFALRFLTGSRESGGV